MQVKMIIFSGEDGLDVLIWGKWIQGSMRRRHFDNRAEMIATLKDLHLLDSAEARKLEAFVFLDQCPIYSSDIEEDVLTAHGFILA